MSKLDNWNQKNKKANLVTPRPGMKVKVWQKIKEADKERLQAFEGLVIAQKHGKSMSATFTVRKLSGGIGVEKTYPLHSPLIDKIEVVGASKARRSKLYYLRDRIGKHRMKRKEFAEVIAPAVPQEVASEGKTLVSKEMPTG